jgi:putative FmdB family regulatory protein
MPLQGFECNGCGSSFEDIIPDNTEEKVEIKCPQCSSRDVVPSETASEFLELLNEIGGKGG